MEKIKTQIKWARFLKRFLILGMLGIVLASEGYPANSKVGTSGAQFLKIGAGARPTAMGDAFVGIADDVNAAYFNPAGLGYISRPQITGMHTQWFEDMSYQFGAFAYPTDLGAFAVSAATLKVDGIQRRNSDESLQGNFEAMDAAYGLSFARNLGPLLSVGITARYFDQTLDSASAGTWSGDVGVMKKFGKFPMSLGLAVRHFGQEVEFREESDPLPLTVDLGLGTSLFKERLNAGVDIRKPRDNDVKFGVGTEYIHPLSKNLKVMLRGGYNSSRTDAGDATGLTLGGGMGINKFDIDFAWIPLGDLGSTFRYSATFRF